MSPQLPDQTGKVPEAHLKWHKHGFYNFFRDQMAVEGTKYWVGLHANTPTAKVWTPSLLYFDDTQPSIREDGWHFCGYVRKGQGYRFKGRFVVNLWQHDKGSNIDAAFVTEAEAVKFMIAMAKEWM